MSQSGTGSPEGRRANGTSRAEPPAEAPSPASEPSLRDIIENSPDIIVFLDLEGNIRFINSTVSERTPEEVIGSSAFDYFSGDHDTLFRRTFEEAVSTGEPRTIEILSRESFWWLSRLVPIKPIKPIKDQERVESVLLIATEITERKRAEEALRESETRFRTLAETTSAAIFVFQGARMIYANPSAELITGYGREELLEMNFWDVIHPDHRDLVKTRGLARQAGAYEPRRYEVKLQRKTGEVRWVDYSGSVFELGGRPAVVGTAVDVTTRKEAEEERERLASQFQHAQKLESLGVLAGGLAHDFNNLLTGILGSASLAAMKVAPDSPAAEQLSRILLAAEKAAALTSKMLAYAGKGQFVLDRIDLNEVVERAVALVGASVGDNVTLQMSLAPNLPAIDADPNQLQQVVTNLVTNAAEAMENREGRIVLRTGAMTTQGTSGGNDGASGASVFLEVRDDGPGIDEEARKKIFDPFFSTKFTGRGLGLAAAAGIVRAHRGSIRVDSLRGRGSTFTVLLPAATGGAAAREPAPRERPSTGTGTILVVDDEEGVRSVARASLEECGYRVLTASDGATALSCFETRAQDIDAILLDLTMPHMTGDEALDALQRIRPDVKVVVTSGHGEQEVAQRFEGRGLAGFLRKPFRAQELIDRIEQALTSTER